MRTTLGVIAAAMAAVAAIGGAHTAPAQTPEQKVTAFRQLLAENQAKRRMFTWLETTHVAYEGIVKMTKVSDCQFPLAGRIPMCNELSLEQAPPPSGFIRRRIAEKKADEMKAYMDTVKTLVAGYVPLNTELVRKAYESGNVAVSPDPSTGADRLIITSYKQPNDTVKIVYRAATKSIIAVDLSTYVGTPSAPVTAQITFATLPNGVFYAYQKTLKVPSQSLVITVTSTDFSELIQQP